MTSTLATRRAFTALGIAVMLLLAACSSRSKPMGNEPAYKIVVSPSGEMLASNRGMTLYVFANDSVPGISMCNDSCAANWPPLIALNDARPAGKWTVVQRADGLKQWAYNGKPLYGWHDDKREGDMLGDGRANGAWSVARP
jgi:predicted lipoprotein with Yx(FWY)xxD motif